MVDAVKSINIRQFHLFERETLREAGKQADRSVRHVVAGAVFDNPFTGSAATEETITRLADILVEIGAMLATRALARFKGNARPCAYGKGVIVGTAGDVEQGGALIHLRLGLAMRKALGAGPALIPGSAEVAGPGTSIDIVFGGANDAWNYDAMDAITVSIPRSPLADEIALFAGYGTARANARLNGASADQVDKLIAEIKAASA